MTQIGIPTLTGSAADDAYAIGAGTGIRISAASQRIRRIWTGGNSYGEGYTPSGLVRAARFSTLVARSYGAEDDNHAKSASVSSVDDGTATPNFPGGWTTAFQTLRPQRWTEGNASPTDVTAAPYAPMADLVLYTANNINDLNFLNATAASSISLLQSTLNSIVCRARAGGLFCANHSSVVQSSWALSTSQPNNSSNGSMLVGNTVGCTATITVPADFPGGEIDLNFGVGQAGALYSITVGGVANGTLDTRPLGVLLPNSPNKFGVATYRVTGLSAGAHTIVITGSALGTSSFFLFDSWSITAPQLPLVVLYQDFQKPSALIPYSPGGAAHAVVNADIVAANAMIATLAATFTDGMVLPVDCDQAFAAAQGFAQKGPAIANGSPGSLMESDNLHPNANGHAVIAAAIQSAVDVGPRVSCGISPGGNRWRQSLYLGNATPTFHAEPTLGAGWSMLTGSGIAFTKNPAGTCFFANEIKYAGTTPTNPATDGNAGITVFPPGYWPHKTQNVVGVNTVGAPVMFTLTSAGLLTWISGDPSAGVFLDPISWSADG